MKRGANDMSEKLSATKLKMAALGNHMIEAGKEIYINPPDKNEVKTRESKKEPK